MHKLEYVDEHREGFSPGGDRRDGYTTYDEPAGSPLAEGVIDFLARLIAPEGIREFQFDRYQSEVWSEVYKKPLTFTVHDCWSGYSEYTITQEWSEISFVWGKYEHHFGGMAEFFRALADSAKKLERL